MLFSATKLARTYVIAIAFIFGGLCVNVYAQKKPTALDAKTPLSSLNKEEYLEIAKRYRNVPNEADRNRLIFKAVSQIDMNFRSYQRSRRVGRDAFEIFFDVLEAGAVAATSITNGLRAKSVITDGLAFLKGSRSSVNKNLRLLELQVLFNRMRADRAIIMARILSNVEKSDAEYPFERAVVDIVDYYLAGTMDNALAGLANETGREADTKEEQLETKKRVL